MTFFAFHIGSNPPLNRRPSRHFRSLRFAALSVLLLFTALTGRVWASAQDIELSWEPAVDNVDTNGISFYRVFYGTQSGVYTNSFVTAGALTDIIVDWLPGGATYYFAVQANDAEGHFSPLSNETSWTLPVIDPIVMQPQMIYDDNGAPAYLQLSAIISPADSWELDSSPDLVNWTPYDYGDGDSIFEYIDMTQAPIMFFRVQRVPN